MQMYSPNQSALTSPGGHSISSLFDKDWQSFSIKGRLKYFRPCKPCIICCSFLIPCCSAEVAVDNMKMNVHDCVPVKLYLQKRWSNLSYRLQFANPGWGRQHPLSSAGFAHRCGFPLGIVPLCVRLVFLTFFLKRSCLRAHHKTSLMGTRSIDILKTSFLAGPSNEYVIRVS